MKTPLEVYRLLAGTNCGDCGVATCMAFAAAVIKQEKQLRDCPGLDDGVIERFGGRIERQVNLESIQQETLNILRERVRSVDILPRAGRVGGRISGDALVIQCLGKDFEVSPAGEVKSNCHTHAWFSIPLLDYILVAADAEVAGRWLPFRELPSGQKWSRLFEQRCEKPLKQIADEHPDLFGDLVSLFSASTSAGVFNSDISVVLHPLPKVPILICYWKKEDGMDSKLHLFFDESAECRLQVDSLFTLGTGFAMMLEKIMLKHRGEKMSF